MLPAQAVPIMHWIFSSSKKNSSTHKANINGVVGSPCVPTGVSFSQFLNVLAQPLKQAPRDNLWKPFYSIFIIAFIGLGCSTLTLFLPSLNFQSSFLRSNDLDSSNGVHAFLSKAPLSTEAAPCFDHSNRSFLWSVLPSLNDKQLISIILIVSWSS